MQIPSSSIFRLLRHPNLTLHAALAPMQRLSTPSRSLISSMVTAPSRWWPQALARRDDPLMEPRNRSLHRVARFPHGSRNMASGTGIKGDEFKPERRHLIPSDDQFTITQGMNNEKNRGATEEFIAHYGHVHPANSEEVARMASGNILYGVEDAGRVAVEVMDGKQDFQGTIMDVDGMEDVSTATGLIALCNNGEEDVKVGNQVVSDSEECESQADEEDDVSCYEDCCSADSVYSFGILGNSSHRDGSIYKGTWTWQTDYCTADVNETRLEAMRLSDPTEHCFFEDGICMWHPTSRMLQIFSVKLAKIPVDSGLVELYGYIAVRDHLDLLRNYVVNIGRDEPIIVEQGSLIEMAGPKRGIELYGTILIEYDMRIKRGEQENDDLQVIDGASIIDDIGTASCHAFTGRIHGDCGAVDIIVSCLDHAVEATVEVVISEVQSNFDLCLGCFVSGLPEEIGLFHGTIREPRALRRSVVAVVMGTCMDLKFEAGSAVACCSFKVINHGCSSQQIQIASASISVKVTWSCTN